MLGTEPSNAADVRLGSGTELLAEMIFKKYDKDKSGELDFAEFRKARCARSLWLGAAGGVRVCACVPWLPLPFTRPARCSLLA